MKIHLNVIRKYLKYEKKMMVRVSVSNRLPGSGGMSGRRSVASVVPRPYPELPGRFGHATEDQSQPC